MNRIGFIWGLAWSEFVRRWLMVLRYPVDYLTGVIILYLLFVGIFYGVSANFGEATPGLGNTLDGLVLGTCMWFFAISVFNQIRVILEMEAVSGTLEQLFLAPVSFIWILFVRSIVGFGYSFVSVVVLLFLIMATTGRWLAIDAWPVTVVVCISMAGVHGVALVLGGLSLIFKRLGQLNTIVQFAFLFLSFPPIEKLPAVWQGIAYTFPLARGMTLLRGLIVHGWAFGGHESLANLASLAFNSIVYLAIGAAAYLLCERIAKDQGLLGHY